jgi:Hypothetical glycosyl hydrolase 6
MPHRTNRRKFLTTAAGSSLGALAGRCLPAQVASDDASESGNAGSPASGSPAIPASRGVATRFWIDPSIAAWQPSPWRKVHIEFHNSRHMPKLGERFNADEFGDRLLEAHVTGATVFAKDMYGYCYYPSSLGPMHPGVSFDILGAQVAALRKRKIQVLAYYMTTLNPQLAETHPEWLNVQHPSAGSASKSEKASPIDREYNPWEWSFSLAQEDYVKEELARLKDLVSRYELDGVWLDGIGADAASTSFLKRARVVIKHDMTPEAVNASLRFVRENGDILAHHIEGVPWAQALNGQPFPKAMVEEWEGKKLATPPNGKIYLAISPGRGT